MLPIVVITPIHKISENFKWTIDSVFSNMTEKDLWVIVIDRKSPQINNEVSNFLSDSRETDGNYMVLTSKYKSGAGNTRNFGLDFVYSYKFQIPIILSFLDAGDWLNDSYFNLLRRYFEKNDGIVSFSYHIKSSQKIRKVKHRNTVVTYFDFLKNYSSACLTTSLKVSDIEYLKIFRFGKRKRANDQLFFLSAVREFGKIQLMSEIVATYNITEEPSLSNRKSKMPLYKFLALKDHRASFLEASYYFCFYVKNSILKMIVFRNKSR